MCHTPARIRTWVSGWNILFFSGILPLDYGGIGVSHTGYRTRSSGLKGQYPKPCRPYGKKMTAVGFEPTHKTYWILRPTP